MRQATAPAGSLWAATMPDDEIVRGTPLTADLDVDVAVIGAGYTGLWTAYALTQADATLRIAVLEREHVGFGASGRNGGWCSADLATSWSALAADHGEDAAVTTKRAMQATVDEVGRFAGASGVDFVKGGTITLARTAAQHARLAADLEEARRLDSGEEDLRWLTAGEIDAMCRARGTRAAVFTPHCGAVHPLRLVHAIARACIARGVRLYDHTAVVDLVPHRVITPGGAVRADAVVVATEAFTVGLRGRRRDVLPIYSLMVASDPLDADQWEEIGLAGRPTFHDARHSIVYGQRTADDRIAFGGRGAPYHFGSRVDPAFDTDERVRTMLIESARELFPVLAGVDFPYHWGGAVGIPRDWRCTVRFDAGSGFGVAGGYAGDGVSTANVAGRTLADLITGRDTDLVRLPWVGHRSRRWEPEPLRWLGVNLGRLAASAADAAERGSGRAARRRAAAWSRLLGLLTGD